MGILTDNNIEKNLFRCFGSTYDATSSLEEERH